MPCCTHLCCRAYSLESPLLDSMQHEHLDGHALGLAALKEIFNMAHAAHHTEEKGVQLKA